MGDMDLYTALATLDMLKKQRVSRLDKEAISVVCKELERLLKELNNCYLYMEILQKREVDLYNDWEARERLKEEVGELENGGENIGLREGLELIREYKKEYALGDAEVVNCKYWNIDDIVTMCERLKKERLK